jgi:UDP-glucose 4-epimerase
MRIAIAGASGLIGSAVAASLSRAGHALVRIGRDAACDVVVDLATTRGLEPRALDGCDALVHAAGVTDEDFADRERALAKAERGAQALIEAAQSGGVRRLVYFSTAHVYGPLEGVIDERHAEDPRSDYARAHLATERRFRAAAGSAAALVVRPCAVFGVPPSLERFARWSLIPFDFPRQSIGGRIVLKSSGEQRRNFVSSDALAALVSAWLARDAMGAAVANAPGPDEMTVYNFAKLCARLAEEELGRPCSVERPAGTDRAGEPLEFRSLAGGALVGTPLQDHVRALVRALSKKAGS